MPIDASIPLQVQQPQNPLDQYARATALKNALGQGQLQQQQVQAAQLENQQRQQTLADQQKISAVLASPDVAGDIEKGLPRMAAAGVSGAGILALQKAHIENQEHVATTQKAIADAREAAGKAAEAQQNLIGNALQHVKDQGYTPESFAAAANQVQFANPDLKPLIDQMRAQIAGAPDLNAAVKGVVDNALAQSGQGEKIASERATRAKTEADTASTQAKLPGEQAQSRENVRADASARLGAAKTPQEYQQILGALPYEVAKDFAGKTPEQARQLGMTAEQQNSAAETGRHNLVEEKQGSQRVAIEGQNAAINAKKFALEFGGDAVKGWAKQIADNPDSANDVPKGILTPVMRQFTTNTGLPFPKPLAGTAVDQERASRNALDAVQQIQDAIKDPEIQSRLGPILGRLGSAEQAVGTATGLTPAQEAKAQQLRTNMRYLVFQEGKALLGGRLPQQLVEQLEKSSPSVKMDAGTLQGAMSGVADAANRNLDQSFKQRFGANADASKRPGRAAGGATANPAYKPGDTRVVNGKTYTRDNQGNWNAK